MLNAENDSYLRAFVTLRNPLTREQSVMRTSLIPGLLSTLKENIARGETDLKLFEWGNIFIAKDREALPEERLSFAAVMTGMYKNEGLHREIRHCDFYDLKGAFQVLFRSLGLRKTAYRRDQAEPWYHPGISCGIYEAGSPIGRLGQINPFTIDRFALKTRSVYLCEIDVAALAKKMGEEPIQFAAYSRFPAVIRDLSIVLDSQIESAWIYEIIEREGGKLVESIEIFDLYKGDKIGPSKRAISFRICYRSKESTLNGKSVNRLHEKVINRVLKETGGKLREA
jgi:phenylalanyl-tRNA synthetase beta chain